MGKEWGNTDIIKSEVVKITFSSIQVLKMIELVNLVFYDDHMKQVNSKQVWIT